MEKRFDIASAMIHTCLDNHLPVISASITVLNIKQGGRSIHEPGFTLVATDGLFHRRRAQHELDRAGVEVKESLTLDFDTIVVSTEARRQGQHSDQSILLYDPKQSKP